MSYVSRATDIDWRDTSTVSVVEKRKGRRRSTILCNIYPSCLLIYLALPIPPYAVATPSYDLPVLPHAPGVYTYIPSDSSARLSFLSSTALFFLSAHHLFLVARTVYEARISARKTAGASFVYPAITIVDRCDVGYTPRR